MKRNNTDAGKYWKITIFAMIGLFIVATAASLVVAKQKVSKVVDADYYSHGLHYAEAHSKTGNAGNGWTMIASIAGSYVQVMVRDEAGLPVSGGHVVYNLDRAAGNRDSAVLDLSEAGHGMYRVPRPENAQGELHGTMRFTKGEATIIGTVVVIN